MANQNYCSCYYYIFANKKACSLKIKTIKALHFTHHLHSRFFFRQMSHWLFLCASVKLTHWYNTHANHGTLGSRELKDEIARLTAMMESVLAAQSQSSLTPATPPPPQRIVISEVVTSTVSATQFALAMPVGFSWGMPPKFMPEGFAPTFASMLASSPIMSVPPPVVHTLPRFEDTIWGSGCLWEDGWNERPIPWAAKGVEDLEGKRFVR